MPSVYYILNKQYDCVDGPFRTKKAAKDAAKFETDVVIKYDLDQDTITKVEVKDGGE